MLPPLKVNQPVKNAFHGRKKPTTKSAESRDRQVEGLKLPPHSIEAEQSVLGGLMLDNERWDNVAERVSANDFFNRAHRLIFNEMQRLLEMSKPIDLITLSESLEQKGELESAGGFAYLAELAKNTPSAANIGAYADIVRERAVVREMIAVANEIADAGYDPQGRSSEDLLDLAESRVFQIAENRASKDEGPKASTAFWKTPSRASNSFISARTTASPAYPAAIRIWTKRPPVCRNRI
ncbi:Replicative DNA helicase [Dickeya solani]|nr:Replicative DNA helicase [Dickeya solani]